MNTDATGLPDELVRTLIRRINTLPPETVETLRLASLLGSEFALKDLATIAGRSVLEVATALGDGVDAAIVAGTGEQLAFRHDLIREAIYEELAAPIRTDLHLAAGRALAAAGAPAPQVARHYKLGAEPPDVDAAEWLTRAGHEVAGLNASTAAEWLEHAPDLAPATWPARSETEAALIQLLADSGRVDDALARAASLLDRSLSPEDELVACRAYGSALAAVGQLDEGARHFLVAADLPDVDEHDEGALRCRRARGDRRHRDARRRDGHRSPVPRGPGPDPGVLGAQRLDVLAVIRAKIHADEGNTPAAREELAEVWTRTAGLRGLLQWTLLGPMLVELHLEAGEVDAARRVAREVGELAERSSSPVAHATRQHCHALLEADPDAMVEAVDTLGERCWVMQRANAAEQAAALLTDQGRTDEAVAMLRIAESIHRTTGATRDLTRVHDALRATGASQQGSRDAKATHGWDALSPKELQVAELVAAGLSNPQIGERLFISRRTVESHVSHVFQKLGLSNRTQLATETIAHLSEPPAHLAPPQEEHTLT